MTPAPQLPSEGSGSRQFRWRAPGPEVVTTDVSGRQGLGAVTVSNRLRAYGDDLRWLTPSSWDASDVARVYRTPPAGRLGASELAGERILSPE